MPHFRKISFPEAVDINPKVAVNKGEIYPFVDMNAVSPNNRSVHEVERREFSSGGAKFIAYDTLMARITPCLENGKIARYIPIENIDSPAFGSTEFIVIRGKEGVTDNNFAYYLTRWSEFRNFAIAQMTGSSGRQRVPVNSLEGFSFYLPPLPTQERIADILGSLDDKIELNRQMNATLEAMARAIFKSWFVDFDPVYAKMEGRDYPLPAEIMDLFPDSLVDSELGPIPQGWEVGSIDKIVERHKAPNRYTKSEVLDYGKVPVYEQGNSILMGYHNNQADLDASITQPMFIFGDHTCIMKLIVTPYSIGPNVIPLTGKKVPTTWAYYSAIGKQDFEEYRRHWMEFKIKETLLPDEPELLNSFVNIISPLIEKKSINEKGNTILEQIRDTLLPRLMSGEVGV